MTNTRKISNTYFATNTFPLEVGNANNCFQPPAWCSYLHITPAKTPVIKGKNNKAYVKFIVNNDKNHSFTSTSTLKLTFNPIKSPIHGPTNRMDNTFDFLNLNHSD